MNTENRFNLIDEPWIPIVEVGRVSLKQIFSEPYYRALGGNPIQKIALTKLLLAIAQAAYTPKDDEDWEKLGSEGLAQKCLTYLEKWHDRFWLYGDKPFLQMPKIALAEVQSFGAVLPEISTGNTTVLIESQIEKNLTEADKALTLISLMGFCLGGKKTDNSVVLSIGYLGKSSTSKPGPSLGFMGFLHSFLLGETLQQTLWFNLFTTADVEKVSIYPAGVGIVPWEKMPEGECCDIAQALKKSLMGRLIPLARFCLLEENGLHYSEGIAHPGYKEGAVDPTMALNSSGKTPKIIWVVTGKRPWRDLTALLSFVSNNSNEGFICLAIKCGLDRIRRQVVEFGLWSGGLRVSSNAGEQYFSGNDDFVESTVTLTSKSLGSDWYAQLEMEMHALNTLSKILYSKIINYFKTQTTNGEEQAKSAGQLYWQLCERQFQYLVNACGVFEKEVRDKSLQKSHQYFASCVYKAYDAYCPKETARQLEAWAKDRPNLAVYLSQKEINL